MLFSYTAARVVFVSTCVVAHCRVIAVCTDSSDSSSDSDSDSDPEKDNKFASALFMTVGVKFPY